MRYYFTPARWMLEKWKIIRLEDVDKLELLCMAGGNVK